MKLHGRTFVAVIVACVALGVAAAPAMAAPSWAPASSAAVKPGNQTHTDGAQCTSNFVFYDGANNVYLGQAAHCSGTGAATETDGCDSASLPLGTPVEVEGASKPGSLVYNSWISMQKENQADANTCAYNDFALVKLDPADAAKVNPSVPFWGGPTGLTATQPKQLASVYSYGNSELRAGITQLSPKVGKSLGPEAGDWTNSLYTVTPGIPGDSGSGFMDASGNAFGVLSTVAIAPLPASNGVGNLSKELAYAGSHGANVTLAKGTEPFDPKLALP
jgi:hypothetical protein